MSESHSVLPNILKKGKLTSPCNSIKLCNFKDTCSPSIFHDSGYNESLKDPSFDYTDAEHKGEHNKRSLPEYFKHTHSSSLCTSVLSPIENRNTIFLSERKEASLHSDYFETPRVAKKDLSLRRRLLVSKAASAGALGCTERLVSSLGQSQKKTCLPRFLSFDERISKHALNSPREKSYKPLATSTLKSEDPPSGCQKLRLLFSQQRTSTIDDSKPQGTLLSEPDCLSPIQSKSSTETPNSFFDSALTSFNDQSICSELVRDTHYTVSKTNDDKCVTPVNSLVEGFNLTIAEIYTPPTKEISNLNLLTPDSSCNSSYNSLGFDRSEDSLSDHEGSFQELLQKCRKNKQIESCDVRQKSNESSFSNSKRKVRKLLHSRRLSTLSECGSQSEKEDCDIVLANSQCTKNPATGSLNEDHELVFNEDDNNCVVPNLENLSRTPALQVVHILFMQSRSKRMEQNELQKNIKGADLSAVKCIVAQLIGKKMGIEKIDVLTELRDRNLKHILTMILDILTVESLYSMWNVSKNWREIIIQDKYANRRRKLYMKQLRTATKGSLLDPEDAATRLMMTRFALRRVQAQAKSSVLQSQLFHNESLTPLRYSQSTSKQDKYIKVAQTLFSDEALKPCPKCQCPAKYQSIKNRGLCSREDCAFDFCILCLCAFHGSRDCSSLSTKRQNRKDALPGSAKSKRNLKRL
ncbi:F-box only protein 43 isoform X1 [Pogona vitticeps]|nr:F-box only protein 43 [Pogona vitticeps]